MFCWVNVVVVVVVDSSNEEWTVNSELPLTDSGKTIDPTRDGISGESQTSGVAEMVAILSDEIVSISSVFGGEFFHNRLHLAGSHVGFSDQNRFSESETFAPLRFPLEYPRRRILVRPEREFDTVNCTRATQYEKFNFCEN